MTWSQRLAGVEDELSQLPKPSMRADFWLETQQRRGRLISGWWWWLGMLDFPVLYLFVVPVARRLTGLPPALPFAGPMFIFDISVIIGGTILLSLATVVLTRRAYRRALRTILNERGYPVCMTCGYSLTGLTSPRCPECGQAFSSRL